MSTRKKSCRKCTEAKARCDLQRPACLRCEKRGFDCQYAAPPAASEAVGLSPERRSNVDGFTAQTQAFESADNGQELSFQQVRTEPLQAGRSDFNLSAPAQSSNDNAVDTPGNNNLVLDFSGVRLVATTDSIQIRNRWLESFLPSFTRRQKFLQPYTVQYLSVILKSYPRQMLRHGGLPSFIHPLQVAGQMPQALANCYSLVLMWEGRAAGSESMVTETVQREMKRLLDEHESYSQMETLAAFQAYLLYTIMLFHSPANLESAPLVDHTIVSSLQELASRTSLTGLVCSAELTSTRPSWESWIVAQSKRRTILTMSQFDNVFNSANDNPMFISEELRDLPLPSSKELWQASKREVWESEYDRHLREWGPETSGEIFLSEFWPPVDVMTEARAAERKRRIEKWAQEVDEFGMTLFAVATHIHGFQ